MVNIEEKEFKLADLLEKQYCSKCGNELPDGANFCPVCGYNEKTQKFIENEEYREVNKWASLLLCFFFGMFGVHKFYEGKIWEGILYIFTIGIFGIGYLIDIIIILFKPNPYYVKRKKNR